MSTTEAETLVDEWDPTETDAADPAYEDLVSWVEDWLARVIRRRVGGTLKWCPRWWAHEEAVARLGSLWAAWEMANAEGGSAMSQWWVYHWDSQWPILTDVRGPFAQCDSTTCVHADPLPTAPYTSEPGTSGGTAS